jgi:membrane-associated phospholipid phosphatase
MHLPLLHISSRQIEQPPLDDPLGIGQLEGTDWIPWLANPQDALDLIPRRTYALDIASLIGAAVGSEVMYFALIGALFSAFNRKRALEISGVILPSVVVNQFFKARFRFPRPPKAAHHELAFVAPGDFTFPSGHAQNAVALGLYMAFRSPQNWMKVVGLSLATSIPLSRVYLGVHYPRDVLAGALLGVSTIAGAKIVERPFTQWWHSSPRGPRSFSIATAAMIFGILSGTPLAAFPLGVAGGMAVGHDTSWKLRKAVDTSSNMTRALRTATGLVVTFSVGIAIRPLVKRDTTTAAIVAGTLVGLGQTLAIPLFNDFNRRFSLLRKRSRRANRRIRRA